MTTRHYNTHSKNLVAYGDPAAIMLTAPQVILLFSGLTVGLMGLLLVFLARGHGSHLRGMSEWGSGLLLVSSTIIIMFLARGLIALSLSILIAQTLVIVALMLINNGLRRFFDERNSYSTKLIASFLGLFVLGGIVLTWVYPSMTGRTIFYTSGGIIILADMLKLLFRYRNHGAGVRILGLALLGFISVRLVRIVLVILGVQSSESLFDTSNPELVLLVMPSVLVPLATLAFILMGSEKLIARLNQIIRHDDLTGAMNKTSLYAELEREIPRSVRYQRPLSLMMIDLDNFKAINDKLGHLQGDQTLKEVVAKIKACVRETDLVARFGGDEFAVLLTETDIASSRPIAQRLLAEVHGILPENCGASIGLSSLRSNGETPDSLIHRADQALYKAKTAGKNQLAVG